MIVPRVRTPVLVADFPDIVRAGYTADTPGGPELSDNAVALACAMLEEEHGRHVAVAADKVAPELLGKDTVWAIWGNNWGNHDATRAEQADRTVAVFETVPEHEGSASSTTKARHVRRAYPDATAGASGFWTTIRTTFSNAYQALIVGDAAEYVHALKVRHYFTADETVYLRGVEQMVSAWRKRLAVPPA